MDDLASEFAALTAEDNGEGYPPFRWQMRLLRHFLDNNLPSAVDIPTGLGKTAVMALWLIARARGADLPRRLVYVVDRRAVVDQASRFAEQLRHNMPPAFKEHLFGDAEGNLPISTLRGGFADNREWLEDPSKSAIVVGTVDMVGSRLLFEGYGVSRGMRPYHAGLLGADTLVVLDEAHLCPPFEALLRQIEKGRDNKFGPQSHTESVVPPFRLMSLSATGRESSEDDTSQIFRLEDDDRLEQVVQQRLTAKKRLMLNNLADTKELKKSIAERAVALVSDNEPAKVIVYCNLRSDALDIKKDIDKRLGKDSCVATELLVGGRRVYERQLLVNWLAEHGYFGGATPGEKPAILIATSAGEVGIDIDADHMLCDLVPYERMVQRLGRVNRRGDNEQPSTIDVFVTPSPEKEPDEVLANCCDTLKKLPINELNGHDASPEAIVELKKEHPELVEQATTPPPFYPELTRPLLDAWSMTSMKTHEGRPEVAPWLRGWQDNEPPQTSIVWRKYLPWSYSSNVAENKIKAIVTEFFRKAPIYAIEKVEVPADRALEWLSGRAAEILKRNQDNVLIPGDSIVAIVIDHSGDYIDGTAMSINSLNDLGKPKSKLSSHEKREHGRLVRCFSEGTLVVDSRISGLQDGMLEKSYNDEVPTADSSEEWMGLTEDTSQDMGITRPVVKFRVREVGPTDDGEGLNVPSGDKDWQHIHSFETDFDANGSVTSGLAIFKWHDDVTDEDSRSILSRPQSLQDHAKDVSSQVRNIAERLDLPDEEVEALSIAGKLHDDGKSAQRWQDAMNAPSDGRPYAKTSGGGNWRLLEGYRHEFGSLLKAEQAQLPSTTRDLVLHLIASHHGYARPTISYAACDEEGPPSLLKSKAGDAALRYARLLKKYGPWGLAWRETLLRSADQIASREWNEHSR